MDGAAGPVGPIGPRGPPGRQGEIGYPGYPVSGTGFLSVLYRLGNKYTVNHSNETA